MAKPNFYHHDESTIQRRLERSTRQTEAKIRSSRTGMQGLTTAAGLLAAAAIGIAITINRYIVACGITLIFLLVLRMLAHLERQLNLK